MFSPNDTMLLFGIVNFCFWGAALVGLWRARKELP